MLGFGIDLAGCTTGKTALAAVQLEGRTATATLLRDSALSKKRNSNASLSEVLSEEIAVLRRCFALGTVAVDYLLPRRPEACGWHSVGLDLSHPAAATCG